MLKMFQKHGIHATWATVGLYFAHSEGELCKFLLNSPLQIVYCLTKVVICYEESSQGSNEPTKVRYVFRLAEYGIL